MPETDFKKIYNTLRKIDMSDRVKTKQNIDYLPWATAWDEVCKLYNANYKFVTFDNSKCITDVHECSDGNIVRVYGGTCDPYLITKTGLMVATEVTIEGNTRRMQLPVMDSRNLSAALEERQVQYGRSKVTFAPATMTDINKATMRCLAKNIAMFGLMINLWTREDIPDAIASQQKASAEAMSLVAEKKKAAAENGDDKASAKVDEILLSTLPQDCNGDPRLCEDEETLVALVKKLKTVRVAPKKK